MKLVYWLPRTMLLDWLIKTEEGNISYEELKMSAQDRQWRWKPAIWQSTTERNILAVDGNGNGNENISNAPPTVDRRRIT